MKPQVLRYGLLLILSFSLFSCTTEEKKEKRRPIYVDIHIPNEGTETTPKDDNSDNFIDEIIVPFHNRNGVKYVEVKVNGVGFEMIFDTGCSDALISVAEANYLYQKGELTDRDIIGVTPSRIADGSIVVNTVVKLNEVIIGDKIRCADVLATVSNNVNAPLLLGNGVLDRVATYTIDNENGTIKFKLKKRNGFYE